MPHTLYRKCKVKLWQNSAPLGLIEVGPCVWDPTEVRSKPDSMPKWTAPTRKTTKSSIQTGNILIPKWLMSYFSQSIQIKAEHLLLAHILSVSLVIRCGKAETKWQKAWLRVWKSLSVVFYSASGGTNKKHKGKYQAEDRYWLDFYSDSSQQTTLCGVVLTCGCVSEYLVFDHEDG